MYRSYLTNDEVPKEYAENVAKVNYSFSYDGISAHGKKFFETDGGFYTGGTIDDLYQTISFDKKIQNYWIHDLSAIADCRKYRKNDVDLLVFDHNFVELNEDNLDGKIVALNTNHWFIRFFSPDEVILSGFKVKRTPEDVFIELISKYTFRDGEKHPRAIFFPCSMWDNHLVVYIIEYDGEKWHCTYFNSAGDYGKEIAVKLEKAIKNYFPGINFVHHKRNIKIGGEQIDFNCVVWVIEFMRQAAHSIINNRIVAHNLREIEDAIGEVLEVKKKHYPILQEIQFLKENDSFPLLLKDLIMYEIMPKNLVELNSSNYKRIYGPKARSNNVNTTPITLYTGYVDEIAAQIAYLEGADESYKMPENSGGDNSSSTNLIRNQTNTVRGANGSGNVGPSNIVNKDWGFHNIALNCIALFFMNKNCANIFYKNSRHGILLNLLQKYGNSGSFIKLKAFTICASIAFIACFLVEVNKEVVKQNDSYGPAFFIAAFESVKFFCASALMQYTNKTTLSFILHVGIFSSNYFLSRDLLNNSSIE